MCVMCSTSVPTLFQYFFYDHIPTFLYIFHEMFFITCIIMFVPLSGRGKYNSKRGKWQWLLFLYGILIQKVFPEKNGKKQKRVNK